VKVNVNVIVHDQNGPSLLLLLLNGVIRQCTLKTTITRVHCLFGANHELISGDRTLIRGEGTKKRGY